MDVSHHLVGIGRDHRERSDPLTGCRLSPVFPDAGYSEWTAVLHGDRVRLLRLLSLNSLPLKKAIHRHDTTSPPVGIAERRPLPYRLTLGVDRLPATLRIIAPIRDQTPPQRFERYLASLVIASDYEQLLARRGVPARRVVVHAAIAY